MTLRDGYNKPLETRLDGSGGGTVVVVWVCVCVKKGPGPSLIQVVDTSEIAKCF